jgi:hypothetical protein
MGLIEFGGPLEGSRVGFVDPILLFGWGVITVGHESNQIRVSRSGSKHGCCPKRTYETNTSMRAGAPKANEDMMKFVIWR